MKVYVEPEAQEAAQAASKPASGRDYLMQRRSKARAHDDTWQRAERFATGLHERLSAHADDARLHPPQNSALSKASGQNVLNAAYLVSRAESEEFVEMVDRTKGRNPECGWNSRARGRPIPSWSPPASPAARKRAPPIRAPPIRAPRRRVLWRRAARKRGGRMTVVERREVALVDLLDRLLAGGVVITGDITLRIADVDLVRIDLNALISSVNEQVPSPWGDSL